MVSTPYDLLRRELGRDGTRPFVTFYDDATGERVELSVTTFDNWVAKTAGLLRDDLAVEPGDRVGLMLPAHWQTMAWAMACWALGTTVVIVDDGRDNDNSRNDGRDNGRDDDGDDGVLGDPAVLVACPETLDRAAAADADEVVALSLRPLGGRFTEPLPMGVLDYAVEVPGHPDQLAPYQPPAAETPALGLDAAAYSLAGLLDLAAARAEEIGAGPEGRVLVAGAGLGSALVDALLVPLVTGGSTVLVRNEDRAGRDERLAAERVTTVV